MSMIRPMIRPMIRTMVSAMIMTGGAITRFFSTLNGTTGYWELAETWTATGDFKISMVNATTSTGLFEAILGHDSLLDSVMYDGSGSIRVRITGTNAAQFTAQVARDGKINLLEFERIGAELTMTENGVELETVPCVTTDFRVSRFGLDSSGTSFLSGVEANISLQDLSTSNNDLFFRLDNPIGEDIELPVNGVGEDVWGDDIENDFNISTRLSVSTVEGISTYTSNSDTGEFWTRTLDYGLWVAAEIVVEAKAGTNDYLLLRSEGDIFAVFNINTGVVIHTTGDLNAAISSVGDGWFRCELKASSPIDFPSINMSDGSNDRGVTLPAGETILVRSPSLREVENFVTYIDITDREEFTLQQSARVWVSVNELVINGGFNGLDGTNIQDQPEWNSDSQPVSSLVVDGELVIVTDNVNENVYYRTTNTTTVGFTYLVTQLIGVTSIAFVWEQDGGDININTGLGEYSEVFITDTTILQMKYRPNNNVPGGGTSSVDNLSVKRALEIAPQATESPQVQAVFDRMSALTTTEEDAIRSFVDGMVTEGMWNDVFEFYAPCLNNTDFLTGFITDTLTQSASTPIHTAGEYIDFTTNAMHLLEGRNFNTYSQQDMFFGVYNVFTAADTTGNSDLFGLSDSTDEVLMRWRGDDTDDFNELIGNTAAGGRSAANIRPTGDFVGLGRLGTTISNLQPGGGINQATVAFVAMPSGFPLQWHGQMVSGTPAAGNMGNSRYSCMISIATPSGNELGKLRNLALNFLIDIGVSGVPIP